MQSEQGYTSHGTVLLFFLVLDFSVVWESIEPILGFYWFWGPGRFRLVKKFVPMVYFLR